VRSKGKGRAAPSDDDEGSEFEGESGLDEEDDDDDDDDDASALMSQDEDDGVDVEEDIDDVLPDEDVVSERAWFNLSFSAGHSSPVGMRADTTHVALLLFAETKELPGWEEGLDGQE
jgi:hypothetical protein